MREDIGPLYLTKSMPQLRARSLKAKGCRVGRLQQLHIGT